MIVFRGWKFQTGVVFGLIFSLVSLCAAESDKPSGAGLDSLLQKAKQGADASRWDESAAGFRAAASAAGEGERILRPHLLMAALRTEERLKQPVLPGKAREADLRFVLQSDASVELRVAAGLKLLSLLENEGRWRDRTAILGRLRKFSKGLPDAGTVLVETLRTQAQLNHLECRLARQLHTKYPAHPRLAEWGPILNRNTLEGKKLSCSQSEKDTELRFKRLQLAGQNQRVHNEIQILRQEKVYAPYTLDLMEVSVLLSEGHNAEAMHLLLSHSEEQKGRPGFWMAVGQIATRITEFGLAGRAYREAARLSPSGKKRSEALYQSAIASYNVQDYDWATEALQTFLRGSSSRSISGQDARWMLSWIHYLRGNFAEAIKGWKVLAASSGRRKSGGTTRERSAYWLAVAELRLGQKVSALVGFQTLARDPSLSYYGLLSYARLSALIPNEIPAEVRLRWAQAQPNGTRDPSSAAKIAESPDSDEIDTSAVEASESKPAAASDIEDASTADSSDDDGDDEVSFSSSGAVRDPRLRDHLRAIERVRRYIGENEAHWELRQLERRARHPQDREIIMDELHRLERFDRSSAMADLVFVKERLRGGILGAKRYWELAYPRAYVGAVEKICSETAVPPELVWSIMRAESAYRTDAHSPVGALGLMQVMPFTGQRLAGQVGKSNFVADELLQPAVGIEYGARYLKRLSDQFSGAPVLIAAAYNAGPHRVHSWLRGFGNLSIDEFIEHIPFTETRAYAKKVARNLQIYRLIYRPDQAKFAWLVEPAGVTPRDAAINGETW